MDIEKIKKKREGLMTNYNSLIDKRVELEKQKAILSFDSHVNLLLKGNSSVSIYKAKSSLTLIHPQGQDFFASCRNKLGWSSSI